MALRAMYRCQAEPRVNAGHGETPLPSLMVAVAAAGVQVGVSTGCAPALIGELPVKLLMAAAVTLTVTWLMSVDVPAVTVST